MKRVINYVVCYVVQICLETCDFGFGDENQLYAFVYREIKQETTFFELK